MHLQNCGYYHVQYDMDYFIFRSFKDTPIPTTHLHYSTFVESKLRPCDNGNKNYPTESGPDYRTISASSPAALAIASLVSNIDAACAWSAIATNVCNDDAIPTTRITIISTDEQLRRDEPSVY